MCLARQERLTPFGMTRDDTDTWGAYRRSLPPDQPVIGKLPMQNIERQHLTWHTRLTRVVRQTRGFSRSTASHDVVRGVCINRDEFGRVSA